MVLSRIIQRAQRIYTNKREMPNNLHRTSIIRKRSYKIKEKMIQYNNYCTYNIIKVYANSVNEMVYGF